jgi:hypothetical protein
MERTPEEAKAHCISAMGQQLGEVYATLWQEVALLYRNWNEYVELFWNKTFAGRTVRIATSMWR